MCGFMQLGCFVNFVRKFQMKCLFVPKNCHFFVRINGPLKYIYRHMGYTLCIGISQSPLPNNLPSRLSYAFLLQFGHQMDQMQKKKCMKLGKLTNNWIFAGINRALYKVASSKPSISCLRSSKCISISALNTSSALPHLETLWCKSTI